MKNPPEYCFTLSDLHIDIQNIELFMGYRPGTAPEPFPSLFHEILDELEDNVSLRGGYRILDNPLIDLEYNTIRCDRVVFTTGKIVARMLRKSLKCAIFVCTAGEGIQHWSARANRDGDSLRAYVIDTFGSELAEAMAEKLHGLIGQEAGNQGMQVTNRYSPGYCGWPVADQQALFSLFPPNFCDIRLSASSLMHPLKSVSGIIGIGTGLKKQPYTCRLCEDESCIYRNLRQKKN